MRIIRKRAYARAGLLGNPSDGYNGKTISFSVKDFYSEVTLYDWHTLEIIPSQYDHGRFRSIYELAEDVSSHGYYGGVRLLKATIKRFVDYCTAQGIQLHSDNFSVRYESHIPRQVGLAGSSSIITAMLRCLMAFYDVEMPLEIQPSFVLSVETDELGISAGLQDRVIQAYEGMVYMDFDESQARVKNGIKHYHYEYLNWAKDLPLYIAYHTQLGEPTEVFHNDIRGRYNRGEQEVVSAMQQFAQYAADGREAILANDLPRLADLIDANFNMRQQIAKLPAWQVDMVETARACGASAKFAGSGGAIVGTYTDEAMLRTLSEKLKAIGSRVIAIRPTS
ncbi:MAG: GHMP kinase [Anaerolineae bacterium]|nr:GHMP kinase [Anaerolineae bacterium]MCA9894925.1 GHMP kinase [Anaerolineae bacterium]MCB9459227.1 GHMP kinase [Anaerolineaceae bacterium]